MKIRDYAVVNFMVEQAIRGAIIAERKLDITPEQLVEAIHHEVLGALERCIEFDCND